MAVSVARELGRTQATSQILRLGTGRLPTVPPAEVLPIDPQHPDHRLLARAGAVIRSGRLVAFPTETVYGLGANSFDDHAIASLYEAKQRDASDPLIVHLAATSDLPRVATDVPEALGHLTKRFWPGPLTIVARRHPNVPGRVSANRPTVAIRVPAHPVARGLIEAAGVPVVAPSANRFMRSSATRASHVVADLGDVIDLVLDGGPTEIGLESTVVATDDDGTVRVLRPGAIPVETIIKALRDAGIDVAVHVGHLHPFASTDGPLSPGLLETHYAPRARLILVSGTPALSVEVMIQLLHDAVASGERPGLIMYEEDADAFFVSRMAREVAVARVGSVARPETIAHNLFASFRDLDAIGVTRILARTIDAVTTTRGRTPVPGGIGLARAIDDRLIRAAGSRVVCPLAQR